MQLVNLTRRRNNVLDKLRNVGHFSLKETFKDVEDDIEKDVHKSIV